MKIGNLLVNAAYLGGKVLTAIAVGATKVWEGVSKYIKFKDPVVEQLCMKWSSDGIGLTPEDAAKVTAIGTTFQGNTEITSFDELELFGVKNIPEFAFSKCTSLNSIKWQEGISMGRAALEYTALSGTLDLTTISNTSIPYWLCTNCKNLEEVIIGENVTSIGYDGIGNSFAHCTALRRAEIKGNAIKTLISPFQNCTSLEHVEMPDTVEYFSDTFNGCKNLTLPSSVLRNARYIGNNSFVYVTIEGDIDCPYLETLSKGAFRESKVRGVVNLGKITELNGSSIYVAFFNCQLLEYVILPSTLMSIAANTFNGCKSMRYIIINAEQPPALLDKNALAGTPSTMKIYVPDESVDLYVNATNWSAYANRIKPISEYQPTNE